MGDTLHPAVSIIIPTYNHAAFLRQALDSVVAQTFTNWEAIVVNNYSEDNTVDVVNSFNDPRVRLVNFRNNGCIAASRNEGLKLANADLVAFLDSDDAWYPDKLKRCLEEFTPEIGLVCHGLRFERDGIFWKNVVYGRGKKDMFNHLLYIGNMFPPSAIVVRKEHMLLVGGFSEDPSFTIAEDYDFLLKLAKAGVHFQFVSDILGIYRRHGGNASKSILRQMDASFAIVNRYFPKSGEATLLDNLKIRRRKALMYVGFARAFQMEGERAEALRLFRKSATTFPLVPKFYAAIVLFFISSVLGRRKETPS